MIKNSKGFAAGLGLLLFGSTALTGGSALAAADTTPPTLNLPWNAAYVVGATLTDSNFNPTGTPASYSTNIPRRVTWSASDASGICGYDVEQRTLGSITPLVTGILNTSFAAPTGTNYDGSFGGLYDVKMGWVVTARDCAGLQTQKSTTTMSRIYTENGVSETGHALPVTTTGAWSTASCACWLGEAAKKSTARGAAITYTVNHPAAGHRAAIVTNTGPDRGSFDIFVDGVLKRTYNSYATATTKKNSVIAWESALPTGTHTIKIVNKGTAGHPRVDVDALLLS